MKRAALPGTDETLLASQGCCASFHLFDLLLIMLLFGLGNRTFLGVDKATYSLCLGPDGILFLGIRFQPISRKVTFESCSFISCQSASSGV